MYTLLLVVIYFAFVSLGLPDSLLGAGWPVMHEALGVPSSFAGGVSAIISCGTVVSGLFADLLVRRIGSGSVTAGSVLLSALSLLGFSLAGRYWQLCVLAVPYGLSAGAVDAVLNNYVALHYAGKHMSWLHCFWGVGASLSPYLMGVCLSGVRSWRGGYGLVFLCQAVIAAVVFCSLPLWKQNRGKQDAQEQTPRAGIKTLLHIAGVKPLLVSFFCYCAMETTAGLWASSYLTESRGMGAEQAARFASLFYLGITGGRFLGGFLTDRLGDKRMIRIGSGILLCGMGSLLLPIPPTVGLCLIGFGCAPIYPGIIHGTPESFGETHSQAIIGLEMSCAYLGNVLMPPLFGVLADIWGTGLYPFFLLALGVGLLLLTERKNKVCGKK